MPNDLSSGTLPIAENISKNIKLLREARSVTQDQLARAAGIPRPTLANLESGGANPTISVLAKVASALHVPVEELISPVHAIGMLYRSGELPSRKRGEVIVKKLLPDTVHGLEMERMDLPGGARMVGSPHRPGTREYLSCESGAVEITVSGNTWRLEPGDVFVFRGDQKHSYANPGGKATVAYSVVVFGAS